MNVGELVAVIQLQIDVFDSLVFFVFQVDK